MTALRTMRLSASGGGIAAVSRRLRSCGAAVCLAGALTVAGGTVAVAADKVVLQLNWDHQFQFAGYYAAKWQGFYEKEGLDVEIRSAFTPARKYLHATREVAEKRADFGTGAVEVLQAWNRGRPLRILATIFQRSPIRFYALQSANIHSPADLIGRRVATRGPSNGAYIELMNVLRNEHIDPSTIDFVRIRSGLGLRDLAHGDADVVTGFSISGAWIARRLGLAVNAIDPASYGVDFYGSALFTRADMIKSNPDMVQRFTRATRKGWEYAMDHGEAIADRIARDLPRTVPLDDRRGFNRFQIRPVKYLTGYPVVAMGHTNPGRWRKMYEALHEAGLVTRSFDESALIYDPAREERKAQEQLIHVISIVVVLFAVGTLLLFVWLHMLRVRVGQATAAIRVTESKNRAILDNASDAILVVDDATGEILDANNEMQRLTGRSKENLIGGHMSSVYELATDGNGGEDSATRNFGSAQARIKGATGIRIPVEISSARYQDRDRSVMIHIFRDISRRLAQETELRQSRERYRAIMDASADGILALDMDGCIRTANPASRTIFGFNAWEMIGKKFTALLSPPLRDEYEARLAAYRADRTGTILGQGQVVNGVRRDGTQFPMEIGIAEFVVDEVRNLIVTVRDITQQHATQQQLIQAQKMDAVGQLTGGVAHDFNNILGAILGNLELVDRKGEMREANGTLIDAAVRAARRGAELTRRLLAFSRAQMLEPKSIDVNLHVREVANLLSRTLGKSVRIETRLDDSIGHILLDPAQLETALLNLLVNARDAMPEGGSVVISTSEMVVGPGGIDLGNDVAPGRYVRLAVSDQGTGMTDAVRARAFDPFFTTKDVGKGTGLGLSMVYGFVKQSGGHVEISSASGRGTSVVLYLPEKSAEPQAAGPAGQPIEEFPAGGETVLLVEDDEAMRSVITRQLAGLGYVPVPVADGMQALAVLEDRPEIDLLLTDIVLPGRMSGIELARRIRGKRPSIGILFISGHLAPTDDLQELRRRNERLVTKPFGIRDLAGALADCLKDAGRAVENPSAAAASGDRPAAARP